MLPVPFVLFFSCPAKLRAEYDIPYLWTSFTKILCVGSTHHMVSSMIPLRRKVPFVLSAAKQM
jgi:hypothetical protein